MPDNASLNSAIQWIDFLTKLLPFLLGIGLFFFTWARTQTVFFPLYRLYQLIGGRKSFHNVRIERHWQAYEDLNNINLWFGLKLRTARGMHEFMAWLERHGLSLEEAARCGPYIDANRRELTLPSRRRWRTQAALCLCGLIVLGVVAQLFLVQDKALLKVKTTGTWAWVQSGHAYNGSYALSKWLGFDAVWTLENEQCLFGDATRSMTDAWDTDVICRLVLGANPEYLRDALVSQRWLGGIAYAGFMLMLVWILYRVQRGSNAMQLVKRLKATGCG